MKSETSLTNLGGIDMETKASSWIGDLVMNNMKTIVTFVIFVCGLYVQYQASMMRIDSMEKEIVSLKIKVDDQYVKLDNMKLDKAVFEANMRQISDMSTDIRQIRDRLEDLLGDHRNINGVR